MIATNKLRFVERLELITESTGKRVRILQQWWQTNNTINLGFGGEIPIGETKGEWRDVPIEKELSHG
jgi:hypothetical protein